MFSFPCQQNYVNQSQDRLSNQAVDIHEKLFQFNLAWLPCIESFFCCKEQWPAYIRIVGDQRQRHSCQESKEKNIRSYNAQAKKEFHFAGKFKVRRTSASLNFPLKYARKCSRVTNCLNVSTTLCFAQIRGSDNSCIAAELMSFSLMFAMLHANASQTTHEAYLKKLFLCRR